MNFLRYFLVERPSLTAPRTYETFKAEMGGTLRLWLKPRWEHDHLEKFVDGGIDYSIISGCWVHERAASILRHRDANQIDCLMLDTTWSVMREYVTAILVAVSHNTAIPLSYAFGPVEDCELYQIFADIFKEPEFGVKLSDFLLESDQGSGLKKYAGMNCIKQRFCLRHFLATLKDRVFGVYVHYLVKTQTMAEFTALRDAYRPQLHEAIARLPMSGLERAQEEFAKAGLKESTLGSNGRQIRFLGVLPSVMSVFSGVLSFTLFHSPALRSFVLPVSIH
jgi:hypothetical protein